MRFSIKIIQKLIVLLALFFALGVIIFLGYVNQ